jgi:preprotein translocase subunit YajC
MNQLLTLPLLQAAASGGTAPGYMQILPFVLIFVVFWFFLIRPQRKKQKETESMIAAMQKNDQVTTIGGIKGVISSVKESTVIIKVDENCKIELNKSAIASVDNKKETEVESK